GFSCIMNAFRGRAPAKPSLAANTAPRSSSAAGALFTRRLPPLATPSTVTGPWVTTDASGAAKHRELYGDINAVVQAAATRLSILSIAVGWPSRLDAYRDVLAQPPRPQIEATGIEEAAEIISAVLGGDIRVEDALPAKHRGAAAQSRPADFP